MGDEGFEIKSSLDIWNEYFQRRKLDGWSNEDVWMMLTMDERETERERESGETRETQRKRRLRWCGFRWAVGRGKATRHSGRPDAFRSECIQNETSFDASPKRRRLHDEHEQLEKVMRATVVSNERNILPSLIGTASTAAKQSTNTTRRTDSCMVDWLPANGLIVLTLSE